MSIRMKMLCGVSGTESDIGPEGDLSVSYDLWATTAVERNDPDYFINLVNYVYANTPIVALGKQRKTYRWREDEDTGHYIFDVNYSQFQTAESDVRWSFDTMGGTIKIFTSRATTSFPSGAPDHQGSIEVDPDGDVQGTEIVIPALKLTARKRFDRTSTVYGPTTFMNFIKTMSNYTGMTNSADYLTFSAQELLFLGATGEYQEGKDNEVEFHFAASQNAASYNIGAISGVAKKGHDYVWISYQHHIDGTGKKSRRPKWAYVERVYDSFPFSDLFG